MTIERGNGDDEAPGRVLVLSGPSSGGKSTTASAFQECESTPWLVFDADVVLSTFPFQLAGDLERTSQRLNRAFFASAADFAREGFDVLCEQVFWSKVTYADALDCLTDLPVRFIEVTADLAAAEQREALRSGRRVGTSREQRSLLFGGVNYDYVLDTTSKTPAEAAADLSRWVSAAFPPTP